MRKGIKIIGDLVCLNSLAFLTFLPKMKLHGIIHLLKNLYGIRADDDLAIKPGTNVTVMNITR